MEKKNTYLGNDGLLHCTVCNEAVEVKFDVPVMGITGHDRMCKCQRELQKQIEERQRQQENILKETVVFQVVSSMNGHLKMIMVVIPRCKLLRNMWLTGMK